VFIIHGTRTDEKKLGVVADECPVCGEVTSHRLSEFYRADHLYFIPMGRGELVGAVLTCMQCGREYGSAAGAYAAPLSEKEARSLEPRELLERTNPRLAQQIELRARWEQEASAVTQAPVGRPDPRVKLAFAQLADVDRRDARVIEYHALLAQWSALDPARQARLLRDIKQLTADERKRKAADGFAVLVAQRFKAEMDGALTFLTGLVVLVAGITVAAILLTGMELAIGIIGSIILALVVAMIMHRKYQRRAHRRFFRKVMLPEAQRKGIEIAPVIEFLSGVDCRDVRIDAQLRALAAAVPLLKEVLAEAEGGLASAARSESGPPDQSGDPFDYRAELSARRRGPSE
jgi:membrane protein implicated in regulation of membrane protease activity